MNRLFNIHNISEAYESIGSNMNSLIQHDPSRTKKETTICIWGSKLCCIEWMIHTQTTSDFILSHLLFGVAFFHSSSVTICLCIRLFVTDSKQQIGSSC